LLYRFSSISHVPLEKKVSADAILAMRAIKVAIEYKNPLGKASMNKCVENKYEKYSFPKE
jgi:hypothetical protein